MIKMILKQWLNGQEASVSEMEAFMEAAMTGKIDDALMGACLTALRMKGESVTEITTAARVMRSFSEKVAVEDDVVLDTCGTGGDGAGLFNVSTASAFVVASAGIKVAKHGNRSNTSSSGSSDVLACAGVKLDLSPQQVAQCINELDIGFMFAPMHHSAMRHVVSVRKALGVRTIFNLLGPLTNPASARYQVLGVFDSIWLEPLAHVLHELGVQRAMVVHAESGLDEISSSGITQVAELKRGSIKRYVLNPKDYGYHFSNDQALVVGSPSESLALIEQALTHRHAQAAATVALNAGAALYIAGCAEHYDEGVQQAQAILETEAAWSKLQTFVEYTNR